MHTATKEFQIIPGVGKNIAQAFVEIGYKNASDLKNQNPEKMYHKLCKVRGTHIDRCVLYVFRCAVYFVSHSTHDPELLKWWNWKDSKYKQR